MRYIYLLEHWPENHPVTISVFTSFKKANSFVENMIVKIPCIVTKLPVNTNLTTGNNYSDNLGIYHHWHYNEEDE